LDTNFNSIKYYERMGFHYHSKTTLDVPLFKPELKGMHRMWRNL